MKKYFFMLIISLIMSQAGFTQGPPTFTDTPIFLGLAGGGIRTFGKYVSKQNANAFIVPVVVPYNVRTNLLVGGIVPFLNKYPDAARSGTGIGDASIFIKYLIFKRNRIAETFRIALKFQETFPTGKTNVTPALGLGAYQSYLGFIGGYITTKFGLYAELGYNAVSKNLDDNIAYNLALGIPLLPVTYPPKQINIYAGFNGNNRIDGHQAVLFFSPAIQVIPHKRFLLEGGVQIPIKEDIPK